MLSSDPKKDVRNNVFLTSLNLDNKRKFMATTKFG